MERVEHPLTCQNQLYQTQVGNFRVSTVKLPHTLDDMHYETMVFACDDTGKVTSFMDLYCRQCHTLEETRAMHEEAVLEYTNASV